jgi:hypothetical protein
MIFYNVNIVLMGRHFLGQSHAERHPSMQRIPVGQPCVEQYSIKYPEESHRPSTMTVFYLVLNVAVVIGVILNDGMSVSSLLRICFTAQPTIRRHWGCVEIEDLDINSVLSACSCDALTPGEKRCYQVRSDPGYIHEDACQCLSYNPPNADPSQRFNYEIVTANKATHRAPKYWSRSESRYLGDILANYSAAACILTLTPFALQLVNVRCCLGTESVSILSMASNRCSNLTVI